eukprot:gene8626-9556_t
MPCMNALQYSGSMSTKLEVATLVFVLCLTISVHGHKKRTKRSGGYPSFIELLSSGPDSLSIQNADCQFNKNVQNCETEYKKTSGQCPFHLVLAQLFPSVSIGTVTKGFLPEEKFLVEDFKINKCSNSDKHETVLFNVVGIESLEVAPRYLTFASASKLNIYWGYNEDVTLAKLSVNLNGQTSVGDNVAVPMQFKKKQGEEDYVIKLDMASLNVNEFFDKFGIDTATMIGEDLEQERNMLGLTSLHIQSPEIQGLYSAGDGFELTATGTIRAPGLPSDASDFYVFVQDFKKSTVEEGQTEASFGKPIGGVFALYKTKGAKVTDAVMSLTGQSISELNIFRRANEVAIAVATQNIFFINQPKLNSVSSKFVPEKGLNFIDKGLSIIHYTENANRDIKNEDGQTKEKILFRGEVTKEKIIWRTPEIVETTMQQVASMVLPDISISGLAINGDTKARFVSMDISKQWKRLEVNFNLTEIVPVLSNNLVSLLNATITLSASPGFTGDYHYWELSGQGREVILDELVEILIQEGPEGTSVTADANIFDMKTLRDRTRATYFPEEYAERFPYALDFPLDNMQYEAVFERPEVLKPLTTCDSDPNLFDCRMKGYVAGESRVAIEIIYYLDTSGPELKVAMLYRDEHLHKVVNQFYGEEIMSTTWMKFESIVIIMRHKRGKHDFEKRVFQNADNFDGLTGNGAGVGLVAEDFILSECPPDAKMCNFLSMHNRINDEIYRIKYYGQLQAKKFKLEGTIQPTIYLSRDLCFGGFHGALEFKMVANDKGDRTFIQSKLYIESEDEVYPAKVFQDASDSLILEIGDKGSKSTRLLKLRFAYMEPLRAKFSIPYDRQLDVLELKSTLHLGFVSSSLITLSGETSRQYIYYNSRKIQFVGENSQLSIREIEDAFQFQPSPDRIRDGEFKHQVIVAFNSDEEIWKVPDYDIEVERGLHFFGRLTLNAEEAYEALISLTDNREMLAEIELPPLRYGRSLTDSSGRANYKNVNLFLTQDSERPESGPTLFVSPHKEQLRGYCQTIGMQGEFSSAYFQSDNKNEFQIELNGKMYNEVDNADILLTTDGEGKPETFAFKYKVDITQQARENMKLEFRNSLTDVKDQITKGKEAASTVYSDVEELYSGHVRRKTEYDEEATRAEKEILKSNLNIDEQVLDISTNCIDKCKTVSMPGIEWKENCITQPGNSKRSLKCMTWNEGKEKVVNVICLLKCEAKKYSSTGASVKELKEIRLLLNRYRELKISSQNEQRFVALLEEAKSVATDTKAMIEEKTNIDVDITKLLAMADPANMVTVSRIVVEEDIAVPHPPCLPFQMRFTINAQGQQQQDGTYDVCFNGEFYKNLGVRMLRVSYPQINAMYKALEEAELRYTRLRGIDKSLKRVMEDIEKDQNAPPPQDTASARRRSETGEMQSDPAERQLERIAKRTLPKFTSMNDKTQMGFVHYSPWAVARRSEQFIYADRSPDLGGAFNMSTLHGYSSCHKIKKVIQQYRDVTSGLKTITDHYQQGKLYYGDKKQSLTKDLQDSYAFLQDQMNKTALSPLDQESMMYWYKYTQAGLKDYFETIERQLSEHNKRGLEYWRSDVSAFFDKGKLFNELHSIGQRAYARSNIPKKDTQTIRQVLSQPGVTLESANAMISSVSSQLDHLHKSTFACH